MQLCGPSLGANSNAYSELRQLPSPLVCCFRVILDLLEWHFPF